MTDLRPVVGGDDNAWGTKLLNWLAVSINPDGTLANGGSGAVSAMGTLAAGAASGATSISLNASPVASPVGRGVLLVGAFTTEAELVEPSAVAGATLTVPALANAHASGDVVLWITSLDKLDVSWFGAKGDNATDDTTALQNAINAAASALSAAGGVVWIPPHLVCKTTSTLILKSGVSLKGAAVEGQANVSQINYYGADATNAVEAASGPAASKIRVRGVRLEDHRTSPTSGDGFHLTATNGTELEDVGSFFFPGNAIYLGAPSGNSDNKTVRNVWLSAGECGIYCDHLVETTLIEQVKMDVGSAGTATDVIKAVGNPGFPSTIIVNGVKSEVTGKTVNLVHADSTFVGVVKTQGLEMIQSGGGTPGYLFYNESPSIAYTVDASGVSAGTVGLIFDSVATVNLSGVTRIDGYRQVNGNGATTSINKLKSAGATVTITTPAPGVVNLEAAGGGGGGSSGDPLAPTGVVYETVSRYNVIANASPLTSQTLRLVAIYLPAGLTVNDVTFVAGTTALAGGTHQYACLFDGPTGQDTGTPRALLAESADGTSGAWAASTAKTFAMATPYTTITGGVYYLGLLVVAATVPSLEVLAAASAVLGLAPVLAGNADASINAPPNPAAAPTASGNVPYAYVT